MAGKTTAAVATVSGTKRVPVKVEELKSFTREARKVLSVAELACLRAEVAEMRELGDVVVVGSTSLGLDHGEQPVARIVDADVGELACNVELVDGAVARSRLCNAELVACRLGKEGAENFVQRR